MSQGPVVVPVLNNIFLQEFMQTGIERVRGQTSEFFNVKVRKDALDRPFKRQNPNLYYDYLYMEYY